MQDCVVVTQTFRRRHLAKRGHAPLWTPPAPSPVGIAQHFRFSAPVSSLPSPANLRQNVRRKVNACLYYRAATKRVNCTLTTAEYATVSARAARLHMKPTVCFKALALAYSDQRYLVPPNVEAKLEAVVFLLRNIANNVNQVARRANQMKQASFQDYLILKEEVLTMEDRIKRAIRTPKIADGD